LASTLWCDEAFCVLPCDAVTVLQNGLLALANAKRAERRMHERMARQVEARFYSQARGGARNHDGQDLR
jgi:hypothetical protein